MLNVQKTMYTKPRHTIVILPDANIVEVSYYCSDKQLKHEEKSDHTKLFIQLDDCICTMMINKNFLRENYLIESIVHDKVIYEKGDLCEEN